MSEPKPPLSATARILLDAIAYPFRRLLWWLIMVGCYAGLMAVFYGNRVSGGRVFLIFALMGVIVRCYLTIIENTITGFGSEAWQDESLRTDGMYEDLGAMFGLMIISWSPMLLMWFFGPNDAVWLDPAITVLGGLGCEYFCMAVTGLVIMGGIQGAKPMLVLPAIYKSGGGYALSSMALMVVPLSFRWGFHAVAAHSNVLASLAGAAVAAFIVIMQARLIGLVYLENKERIGWE